MKLIDKDALVAEIEKRLEKVGHSNPAAYMEHRRLLDFIDTLEVKEVDLEKELNTYLEKVKKTDEDIMFGDFAKHFFELGLKAQKRDDG